MSIISASNKQVNKISLDFSPDSIIVNASNNNVYVSTHQDSNLTVFDENGEKIGSISLDHNIYGLYKNQKNNLIYAGGPGELSIISSNEEVKSNVVFNLNTGVKYITVNNNAIDKDKNKITKIYTTDLNGIIAVISEHFVNNEFEYKILKEETMYLQQYAIHGMVFDEDSNYIYAIDQASDKVLVIDPSKLNNPIINTISLGSSAFSIIS
ncbi:YncE family protein [Bacillus cereus]